MLHVPQLANFFQCSCQICLSAISTVLQLMKPQMENFLNYGLTYMFHVLKEGFSNSFRLIGKCAFHILSQDIKSL